MAEVRVRTESGVAMGLAFETILRYARTSEDRFTFGPFDARQLELSGILLSGDTDGVVKALRKVPHLEITVS